MTLPMLPLTGSWSLCHPIKKNPSIAPGLNPALYMGIVKRIYPTKGQAGPQNMMNFVSYSSKIRAQLQMVRARCSVVFQRHQII